MKQPPSSVLFLVRLWIPDVEAVHERQDLEWHGRIQLIGTGQATTFEDWPTLQRLLEEFLLNRQESTTDIQPSEDQRNNTQTPN